MYMCFNQETAISAFIVGSLFTILNLKKGHIKFNLFFGLISIFIVIIQLLEFFVWRNLNDIDINYKASYFIILITMLQPILFLCIYSYVYKKSLPHWLIIICIIYLFFNRQKFIYSNNKNAITTIDKSGKLLWPSSKANGDTPLYRAIYWILMIILIVNLYNLKDKKMSLIGYAVGIITLFTIFVVYLQKAETFSTFSGIFTTLWCLFCILIPIVAYII